MAIDAIKIAAGGPGLLILKYTVLLGGTSVERQYAVNAESFFLFYFFWQNQRGFFLNFLFVLSFTFT